MNTRFSHHATALALAALVTLGVLAGLDNLAANELASAQAQWAQSSQSTPATAARPA